VILNPLATYLRELRDIRASGAHVPETSFYGPLANLLNAVGRTLKPRVRCIINPKNQGAGIPDGGFFTADQLPRTGEPDLHAQLPARGVMEVKGTSDDAWQTARSAQVIKYLGTYGQVLVTNYRDFILLGRDSNGKRIELEAYRLAESETAFWAATTDPQALGEAQGERFTEFLKRVMLYAAPLTNPADVAWFLASYARDARARIEGIELPALTAVRTALEEALGITFEGRRGDHFFRSTLVQTLFYGIFSAWVLWSKKRAPGNLAATFDWHITPWELHVSLIRGLFEQVAMPSRLGPLGLVEVLDRTGATLNRIEPEAFFARFEESQAVQYFYEPFLEAFDPELRKELGVWYTPPEIVQYMVTRVDTVLREELGIADGLADPRVYVLDPCCGTGAYLVAVRVGGGTLNPVAGDLAITAGWGHAGKGGVTMPGKGRVEQRAYTPDELAAIRTAASALGLTEEQAVASLGAPTRDVYLNNTAYWRNIPASVWGYTIGGYQVIKKWLSYRERALLGRALTTEEARGVTHMARRIAAIVLLSPALDANYLAVKQATIPWTGLSQNG
jgi:hypothetical protein